MDQTTTLILTCKNIITMNPKQPRATAVAIDSGRICYIGNLDACKGVLPEADIQDLGETVLMPGFIDDHSHPILSGVGTMPPAVYIAPWVAPTWDDVLSIFKQTYENSSHSLLFFGFDKILHGVKEPTAKDLDAIFGDRKVAVINNSGHGAYVTTAVLDALGWLTNPPQNPVGGFFLRNKDGSLNGQGYELPAVIQMIKPVIHSLGSNPLYQAAQYYALMAKAGITSTSEMTFSDDMKQGYEILSRLPSCPLRVSLYHMSIEDNSITPLKFDAPETFLIKQGVKLWADGSPWLGNIATSYPYLNTPLTRHVGIKPGPGGIEKMNYSLDELKSILDRHAPLGWQMAFHVNGDLGLDVVLDAYDYALKKYNLLGTDHRWRIEHVGGAQRKQFERAAELGVTASMGPFQFYYWGDVLDGQLFDSTIGAHWQQFKSAFSAGVYPSFHNDGSVSPPNPLLNIQTAVTRRTQSGIVRGLEQAISLDDALVAETTNAAYKLFRDKELGSIEEGKWADFVELSADPYQVKPENIATDISINGTWIAGRKINLDLFLQAAMNTDPKNTEHLKEKIRPCC